MKTYKNRADTGETLSCRYGFLPPPTEFINREGRVVKLIEVVERLILTSNRQREEQP